MDTWMDTDLRRVHGTATGPSLSTACGLAEQTQLNRDVRDAAREACQGASKGVRRKASDKAHRAVNRDARDVARDACQDANKDVCRDVSDDADREDREARRVDSRDARDAG